MRCCVIIQVIALSTMNNENLFCPAIHTFTKLSDSLHKDDILKNPVNIQFCVPDRANLNRHSYERKCSYIPLSLHSRCRDWDSDSTSDDELLESETALQTSNSPYEYQTLVKGKFDNIANENTNVNDEKEIKQEQAKMEITPSELEKQDQAESIDFSELIQTDSKTGKLNKDVVYLNIASMESGDIFVSNGITGTVKTRTY